MEISVDKVDSHQRREENNRLIPLSTVAVFGEDSVHCKCQYCASQVFTDVVHYSNWISVLTFFILFLLLGVFVLCVFPLISSITKDTVHTCPNCHQVLHTFKRFKWPSISNDIVTIRCGSCALVLSKRYVICFLCTILAVCLISMYQWYMRTFGLPDVPEGTLIPNSWNDFLNDCGQKSYLGNHLHAQRNFETRYNGKSVIWEGRLLSVREGLWQKNFIYVNMEPHQFSSVEDPDLLFMFNAPTFNNIIADFEVGDQIKYKVTLLELGVRGSPHLGVLHDINRTKANAELPSLIEDRSPLYHINKPPIRYAKQLAKKIGEIRDDFNEQQSKEGARGGYMVGDELIA